MVLLLRNVSAIAEAQRCYRNIGAGSTERQYDFSFVVPLGAKLITTSVAGGGVTSDEISPLAPEAHVAANGSSEDHSF